MIVTKRHARPGSKIVMKRIPAAARRSTLGDPRPASRFRYRQRPQTSQFRGRARIVTFSSLGDRAVEYSFLDSSRSASYSPEKPIRSEPTPAHQFQTAVDYQPPGTFFA